jgi:hypothetical protein
MEEGKTELFDKLWNALQNPYEEIYPEFSVKRPEKYEGVVGCSSLSCSSKNLNKREKNSLKKRILKVQKVFSFFI